MSPQPSIKLTSLTPDAPGAIAVLAFERTGVADDADYAATIDQLLAHHFKPSGKRADARVRHGTWLDRDGQSIDEVLVVRWNDGGSPRIELHAHGNPALVAAIRESVNTRLPAEFTQLDTPVRALESLLINAATPLVAKIALAQATLWAAELDRLAAQLDAKQPDAVTARLAELREQGATWARALERPPRIAIAGPPNAGKSTLINALVGAERCIASATAGTTRDLVLVPASLNGLPVALIDTAGLPAPPNTTDATRAIAREAETRARRAWQEADIGVATIPADADASLDDDLCALRGERRGAVIVALTKFDLIDADALASRTAEIRARFTGDDLVELCAPRGIGIGALAAAVWNASEIRAIDPRTIPIPLDAIVAAVNRIDTANAIRTLAMQLRDALINR